ncbi:TPA: hypothetical protein RQK93_002055 [Vibrio vulnificus]|nr:hypothetical protein [Vibrio vulnificus]
MMLVLLTIIGIIAVDFGNDVTSTFIYFSNVEIFMLKKSVQALSLAFDYVNNGMSQAVEVQHKTRQSRVELAVLEESSKLLDCKIEIKKEYVKLADEMIALEAEIGKLMDEKYELAVEKYHREKEKAEQTGSKQPQMVFRSAVKTNYSAIVASLGGKETIRQKRERYIKEIASFEAMLEANRKEREELSKKIERKV